MKNTNTSATGGYLLPAPGETPEESFIQTVLAGITGLPGSLVRRRWQQNPPKQPDIDVNWISFSINENEADANAYNSINPDGSNIFQRMEEMAVQCTFYGPQALQVARLLRDGFQIDQNRFALSCAKMAYKSVSRISRAPDLINERWVNRQEMTVNLRAEILRTYPILTFTSISGILTVLQSAGPKTIAITVEG